MDRFSIEDCRIMWFKHAKLSPKEKQAIKTELGTMSGIIVEAMKFIHEKRLDSDREIYVQITFNNDEIALLMLQIRESSQWEIDITDMDNSLLGCIVSEKCSIDTPWEETNFEPPETIR